MAPYITVVRSISGQTYSRCLSIRPLTASFGRDPVTLSTAIAFLKWMGVGMLLTLYDPWIRSVKSFVPKL
ncbi:MAG: hypothetical protein JXA22_06025 [Candidatus Thermoplasmatota archaeon]|nr:hypothetical protein [Candidatus Thermoplasmatota archaeon]